MQILESIILGIIQGLTEFFPISSSGHLILVRKFFGFADQGLAFDAILHLGALLALIIYFRKDWLNIISSLFKKEKKLERKLLLYLILGTIPVVLVGFFAIDYIDSFFRDVVWVATFLIILGLIFLAADKYDQIKLDKKNLNQIKLKDVILIGLAQAVALLPGISRSGITISTGIFSKMKRQDAARFSFLLATPAIFGAAVFSLFTMFKEEVLLQASLELFLGFLTSAIASYFAIKYFLKYLKNHSLFFFAIYVLILGIFLLVGEFYFF